mgnify:CR=1 FL=1
MYSMSATSVSQDIDIAALLRALNHRKTWILGLATLAAVLTYVGLGFVTPRYASEARVIIEREDNVYKSPADSLGTNQQRVETGPEAVESQVQVLLSRDLAMGVVRDLQLWKKPEFDEYARSGFMLTRLKNLFSGSANTSQALRDERILNAFMDRLSVYQIGTSRVIAIEFQSAEPETAAAVANKLADLYLTWQQSEKLKQTREASQWLSAQIKELTKKVESAEVAAEKFRSQTGLFEGENNTSLDAQQLSELNSQIILAKAQRTEAEARAALIQRMLKEKGDVAAAADVLKSNLIQRLLEQKVRVQRTLAETSVTLLPSHPRIRELNSELADLKRQIRDEAHKVVAGLQNEAQIAGAREASLRESLKDLKTSTAKGNTNQIKLRAIEREIKSNRELLESYLARYRDASARSEQGSVPTHASIVSRAHISAEPAFPKKGPISLLAFAAVAFLGFAHTIARELISPQHVYKPDMRWQAREDARTSGQAYIAPPNDGENSSISRVQTSRELARALSQPQNRNVVIMPMSSEHGAAERILPPLREIAKAGQATILVDILGSSDSIARAMGLPGGPGIHEIASGAARFEDVVQRDHKSQMQLISGTLGSWGDENLYSPRFRAFADALEQAYDHVFYLVGPNEGIAVLGHAFHHDPALVLLTEPGARAEDILWQADHIFGDKVDQPPLVILAELAGKSSFKLPFGSRRQAG